MKNEKGLVTNNIVTFRNSERKAIEPTSTTTFVAELHANDLFEAVTRFIEPSSAKQTNPFNQTGPRKPYNQLSR